MPSLAERGLNDRQELFVLEYLIDFKQGDAAVRAGYTPDSSRNIANVLMSDPRVRKRINEELTKRTEPLEQMRMRAVREAACLAFADPTDAVSIVEEPTENPEVTYKRVIVKTTAEMTPETRAAISSIKQGPHGIEIKFYDKNKGLELLGKLTGMMVDKLELSGPNGGSIDLSSMSRDHKDKILFAAAQRAALE